MDSFLFCCDTKTERLRAERRATEKRLEKTKANMEFEICKARVEMEMNEDDEHLQVLNTDLIRRFRLKIHELASLGADLKIAGTDHEIERLLHKVNDVMSKTYRNADPSEAVGLLERNRNLQEAHGESMGALNNVAERRSSVVEQQADMERSLPMPPPPPSRSPAQTDDRENEKVLLLA